MRKINSELPYFIGSYSMTELINKIDEVKEDAEISWNSLGGSVWAGQQFIDFLNNTENNLEANVTGISASMGTAILPFFNRVKGAAQSDLMIHSVSGGANVKQSNEFLYKALAKKIDEPTFKQITGHELKDVMMAEGDKRFEVWFTGKDAKKMGLFDEVYDLLKSKNNSFSDVKVNDLGYEMPESVKVKLGLVTQKKVEINNKNDMEIKDITASALQTGNPEVYNAIISLERERVAEIMNYAQFDMEKANSLIKSGEKLSIKDVEYFMEKKYNAKKIDELEKGGSDDLNPAKITKNEEEKQKDAAFDAEIEAMRKESGINDYLKK